VKNIHIHKCLKRPYTIILKYTNRYGTYYDITHILSHFIHFVYNREKIRQIFLTFKKYENYRYRINENVEYFNIIYNQRGGKFHLYFVSNLLSNLLKLGF